MWHPTKHNFWRDTRGNLSITAGVVGVLLLTAVGASLDGGQMFSTKQRLQSITDAAALMAATPEGISAGKRKALAESSIRSHVERVGGLSISSTTVNVNEADGQVYVALAADVPLIFGGVLGSDMRRVSASSLAEESNSASLNSLSISLVLDLSGSMGDRFDNGSKLASVNSAVSDMLNSISSQFGSEVAAATQISTGVYPFNWGMVDGETVALEPGTNRMLTSMTNLSLASGSVPATAMERAVEDQLEEMKTRTNRDRYIVYVTDGKIDEDRSDVAGRYLREKELFESKDPIGCTKVAQELAVLDALFEPDLVEVKGMASPLSGVLPAPKLPNFGDGKKKNKLIRDIQKMSKKKLRENTGAGGLVGGVVETAAQLARMEKKLKTDKHAGHDHGNTDVKDMAKRIEFREDFLELCEPVQTLRVAEACGEARDNGISIIAINLSGQDKIASNTTDMCISDSVLSAIQTKKKRGKKAAAAQAEAVEGNTRTLPSGIKVRVSSDGQSFAGDANTLEELRDMLGAMLPDGEKERFVRLVG